MYWAIAFRASSIAWLYSANNGFGVALINFVSMLLTFLRHRNNLLRCHPRLSKLRQHLHQLLCSKFFTAARNSLLSRLSCFLGFPLFFLNLRFMLCVSKLDTGEFSIPLLLSGLSLLQHDSNISSVVFNCCVNFIIIHTLNRVGRE